MRAGPRLRRRLGTRLPCGRHPTGPVAATRVGPGSGPQRAWLRPCARRGVPARLALAAQPSGLGLRPPRPHLPPASPHHRTWAPPRTCRRARTASVWARHAALGSRGEWHRARRALFGRPVQQAHRPASAGAQRATKRPPGESVVCPATSVRRAAGASASRAGGLARTARRDGESGRRVGTPGRPAARGGTARERRPGRLPQCPASHMAARRSSRAS